MSVDARARAVMVLGTASHVGKSLLAAALCRILADDGYRVAPFKAQNMSLNSAPTPDGREIGRAQAMQAEAARVAPCVEMNPVLLKPTSDEGSQVVILGRVAGFARAAEYHRRRVDEIFPVVVAAYETLAAAHDVIVLEGAGSPAEINLKATDIANMRMAEAADAACLLVGDIDRGGVFASLLGTLELLEPHERARVRGVAINKFRGDATLLAPGIAAIEARLGVPSLGVIPWLRDVGLDEEDSISLGDATTVARRGWFRDDAAADGARRLRVAVVPLPYLANPTDFAALEAEPSVDCAYAERPEDLARADVVVLPGTKDTLGALAWLDGGWTETLRGVVSGGGLVIGICGGFQLLGESVADPHRVERGGERAGLGLLKVRTVLGREKITRSAIVELRRDALFGRSAPVRGTGYEIHMGRTTALNAEVLPVAYLTYADGSQTVDGAVSVDGAVLGTYLHGLFADDSLRREFVAAARERAGLRLADRYVAYGAERDARFDRVAAHVRASLDYRALLPA